MQLDDVISTTSPDLPRIKEATHRSIRWLDRCISAHKNPERQNLFCIIQGGLDLELRRECCRQMVERDTPGIAIGGLSGGEAKEEYCAVVKACTEILPEGKPRYVMGVVSGVSFFCTVFCLSLRSHVLILVKSRDTPMIWLFLSPWVLTCSTVCGRHEQL